MWQLVLCPPNLFLLTTICYAAVSAVSQTRLVFTQLHNTQPQLIVFLKNCKTQSKCQERNDFFFTIDIKISISPSTVIIPILSFPYISSGIYKQSMGIFGSFVSGLTAYGIGGLILKKVNSREMKTIPKNRKIFTYLPQKKANTVAK